MLTLIPDHSFSFSSQLPCIQYTKKKKPFQINLTKNYKSHQIPSLSAFCYYCEILIESFAKG